LLGVNWVSLSYTDGLQFIATAVFLGVAAVNINQIMDNLVLATTKKAVYQTESLLLCLFFHNFGWNFAQEVQSEIFKYMNNKLAKIGTQNKLFCSSVLNSSSQCSTSVSTEGYTLWTRSYRL